MKFNANIEGLGPNEIRGFRFEVLSAAPASPPEGRFFYNSTTHRGELWNGSSWRAMDYTNLSAGTGLEIVADSIRLAASAAGAGLTGGAGEVLNVGAGSGILVSADAVAIDPGVVATRGFVEELVQGLDVKASVRAATAAALAANTLTGNVLEATANGALTVDGVTVVAGNRLVVKNEAEGKKNGIWVVSQAGGATEKWKLTRATDADATGEITGGTFTFVEEGTTNADSGWVVTNDGTPTLNTTAIVWAQFSGSGTYTAGEGIGKTGNEFFVQAGEGLLQTADGLKIDLTTIASRAFVTGRSKAITFGDGAATTYELAHGLASRDVKVEVVRTTTPWDTIYCDVSRPTEEAVKLSFAQAPAANAFRALISL